MSIIANNSVVPTNPEDFVRWVAGGLPEGVKPEDLPRLAHRILSRPINLILPEDEDYAEKVLQDLEKRGEYWDPDGLTVIYSDQGISDEMKDQARGIKASGRALAKRTLVSYPTSWLRPGSVWRLRRNTRRTALVTDVDLQQGVVSVRALQMTQCRTVSVVNFWRLYDLDYLILAKGRDLPDGDQL